MNLRNEKQNRQLWAIVNQIGLDKEQLQEFVYQFSAGRTTSSRELSVMEFSSLTNHLEAIKKKMVKAPEFDKAEDFKKGDKQRKKFLSVCYELKWTKDGKLNWAVINGWLLEFGCLKKPLNDYTSKELPKLVTQIETILKKQYAKG